MQRLLRRASLHRHLRSYYTVGAVMTPTRDATGDTEGCGGELRRGEGLYQGPPPDILKVSLGHRLKIWTL